MQPLFCSCGHPVFCDNIACLACGNLLGFDPMAVRLLSVARGNDGNYYDAEGNAFQLCANRIHYSVCNGLVPLSAHSCAHSLCNTCQLNRTIPIVERPENLIRWQRLESAKRRMIAGLATFSIKVGSDNGNAAGPMRFDFMEDQRSHPDVLETFVSTGHKNGLITINLLEADEVQRVQQRELSGERQRTLLGHFRHEAGHYFFPQFLTDHSEFHRLFGDPSADYEQALHAYYHHGPPQDWGEHFISAYAASHPMEDWAECFAHVLHIVDGLETAVACGMLDSHTITASFDKQLARWGELVISLNEINRSLGVRDPYPFVITAHVCQKMCFVHGAIKAGAASQS